MAHHHCRCCGQAPMAAAAGPAVPSDVAGAAARGALTGAFGGLVAGIVHGIWAFQPSLCAEEHSQGEHRMAFQPPPPTSRCCSSTTMLLLAPAPSSQTT